MQYWPLQRCRHSCGKRSLSGSAEEWLDYTWGNNFFGELGWGTIGGNTTRPAVVPGFSNAVAIATGDGHTLAIKSDGTVWAWGYNGCGQLGSNGTTNSGVPLEVPGLSNAIAITGGGPSGAGR